VTGYVGLPRWFTHPHPSTKPTVHGRKLNSHTCWS